MAYIKKEIRERVWRKYEKKCAYCGCELEYKKMQVDHIIPVWRGCENGNPYGLPTGTNDIENLNPSCARCNRWKSAHSLEFFRDEISKQIERLKRDSSNFRMALDYGMITATNKPIEFWFERCQKLNC